MKALIPLLLLFACSCPAKPAATPQGPPPPGSGSATTPEPTGPTQGSADPTQGSGAGPTQGSGAGPTQGSGAGPTQGSGSTEPAPTWSGGPAIGENCGANDACAKGLTCVTYYGIAGPRGPQFKSCEIKCGAGAPACPAGHKCITIADGPGQVCRKP
jgi:hypothetical protein